MVNIQLSHKKMNYINNSEIKLNACCMVCDERGIWFVQEMIPILYYYNFEKREIIVKKPIMIHVSYGIALFSDIVLYKDILYLIPNNLSELVIYDIKKDNFKYIKLMANGINSYKKGYIHKEKLYCIPYKEQKIVIYDINNSNLEYREIANCYYESDTAIGCINSTCRIKNNIYCVLWKTGFLLIINLDNEKMDIHYIGSYEFVSLDSNKTILYLYDYKNMCVITINSETLKVNEVIKIGYKNANIIVSENGGVIIDDIESDRLVNLNKVKSNFEINNLSQIQSIEDVKWKNSCWTQDAKGNFIGISIYGDILFFLNDKIKRESLIISKEEYEHINMQFLKKSNVLCIKERKFMRLENFITVVERE